MVGKMWKLKYKVPIGFVFTIQKHVDNLEIRVKKPEENEWKEAIVEKELVQSWGGYGSECGGSRYLVRVKPRDEILSVATGEHSYQACTPSAPAIKNYAVTEIRFEMPCDIKISYDNVEMTFLVRYINEFEVNEA
jgi:hypothetical protein